MNIKKLANEFEKKLSKTTAPDSKKPKNTEDKIKEIEDKIKDLEQLLLTLNDRPRRRQRIPLRDMPGGVCPRITESID